MTAVDHAELKRLAEGAISSLNSGLTVKQIEAAAVAFDVAANPAVLLALLTEIEGLKAERDSNWDDYIAERKSRMEHGAREAGYLDTISRLERRSTAAALRALQQEVERLREAWSLCVEMVAAEDGLIAELIDDERYLDAMKMDFPITNRMRAMIARSALTGSAQG